MTLIVPVSPGQSNVVATGPQFGVRYTFTAGGGDTTRAVFNDPTDADYVGWLTDITGLDSPEVRESADDLIGEDGGVHGDFFHGRRPIVIEGQIDNRPAPHHFRMVNGVRVDFEANEVRNVRLTALQRVTNAMRDNMTMRWAPEGGIEQVVYVRRQQPLRITGAFNKTFQASMVSADHRIYSAQVKEETFAPNVAETIYNDGAAPTPPVFTIYGPASNIELRNSSSGKSLYFASGFSLTAGQYLVVDTANKSILLNGTTDSYQYLTFGTSVWWDVKPGGNSVSLVATGTTGASALIVRWQDAWV